MEKERHDCLNCLCIAHDISRAFNTAATPSKIKKQKTAATLTVD